jgi:hypothetical protein
MMTATPLAADGNASLQEDLMLFHVTWEFVDRSEAGQKRSLHLFSKWTPGPGQFQAFHAFADGGGGVALIEAANASDLAKTVAPWTPFLKFATRPIIPIRESAEINVNAAAWRDAQ